MWNKIYIMIYNSIVKYYCSRKTKTKQNKSLRQLRERRTTIITGNIKHQSVK